MCYLLTLTRLLYNNKGIITLKQKLLNTYNAIVSKVMHALGFSAYLQGHAHIGRTKQTHEWTAINSNQQKTKKGSNSQQKHAERRRRGGQETQF